MKSPVVMSMPCFIVVFLKLTMGTLMVIPTWNAVREQKPAVPPESFAKFNPVRMPMRTFVSMSVFGSSVDDMPLTVCACTAAKHNEMNTVIINFLMVR